MGKERKVEREWERKEEKEGKKKKKTKCEYGDRTSDHSGWEMYRIVAVQGVYFNRC